MTQSQTFNAQIDNGESLDFSQNEILALLALMMHEIASGQGVLEDTLITIKIKKNVNRTDI